MGGHDRLQEWHDDSCRGLSGRQIQGLHIKNGFTVGVIIQPEKGRFGYDRAIWIMLPAEGGYVPMAKTYRKYLQMKGEWASLRDKAKQNKKVEFMKGAADIWLRASTGEGMGMNEAVDYVHNQLQPRRCFISLEYHVGKLAGYPDKKGLVQRIKYYGYFAGRYLCYMDLYPTTLMNPGQLRNRIAEDSYYEGYPDEACILEDGKPPRVQVSQHPGCVPLSDHPA